MYNHLWISQVQNSFIYILKIQVWFSQWSSVVVLNSVLCFSLLFTLFHSSHAGSFGGAGLRLAFHGRQQASRRWQTGPAMLRTLVDLMWLEDGMHLPCRIVVDSGRRMLLTPWLTPHLAAIPPSTCLPVSIAPKSLILPWDIPVTERVY